MCNKPLSSILNIVSSLIVGIGVASIFFIGAISSISVLLYITLILGVIGFIIVLVSINKRKNCESLLNSNLAITSIGSIITSTFALFATSLATASIPVAILIGAIAFFLVLLLIDIIDFLIFNVCKKCCCNKL